VIEINDELAELVLEVLDLAGDLGPFSYETCEDVRFGHERVDFVTLVSVTGVTFDYLIERKISHNLLGARCIMPDFFRQTA
jgi:hypothetical protein